MEMKKITEKDMQIWYKQACEVPGFEKFSPEQKEHINKFLANKANEKIHFALNFAQMMIDDEVESLKKYAITDETVLYINGMNSAKKHIQSVINKVIEDAKM